MSKLVFAADPARAARSAKTVCYVAPKAMIDGDWLEHVAEGDWVAGVAAAAKAASPGVKGAVVSHHTGEEQPALVVVCVLPDTVSRHNSPSRHETIQATVAQASLGDTSPEAVVLGLDAHDHFLAAANAVGRVLPLYSRKSAGKAKKHQVSIAAADAEGLPFKASAVIRETVAAARWAAAAVDAPAAEMTTTKFVREARKLVKDLAHVKTTVITGAKLLEKKLGGLHAVGRAAMEPPTLLILDYSPPRAKKKIALVGKGVVFDTGGLNLKGRPGMEGMKADMGGAAAVTGAFRVLAATRVPHRVIAVVPLAENAIGPDSYRPDDILTMHSGKTVEINNTDAEGRLLLADGVSYVARHYKPHAIFDAATLTGAQLISSGVRHASIVTNREGLEVMAREVGRGCGDMVHPLLFAPEFYQAEFASKVADMRNSVADRMNAQSSCAAQFIYSHIEDLDVPWMHVDLAGPAWRNGRGTGYGVALLSALAREVRNADLES